MPFWGYLIILGALAAIVVPLVFVFRYTYKITWGVIDEQLVRTSKEKWARDCSCATNEEHVRMFEEGIAWGDKYRSYANVEHIKNDGLKLAGEYFDFGFDKCALILQGRAESLLYSYYFAEPYRKLGFNILVIDTRGHGESEGYFNGCGITESKDVPAWVNHIEKKYDIHTFVLHGICIGSASAMLASVKKGFPNSVKALVAEGTFHSFYESFREHLKELKKPIYPVVWQMRSICKRRFGIDVKKQAPIEVADKFTLPLLLMSGKCDKYSLPEKCRTLFDKCASSQKQLVTFDKGAHSHLRINAVEKYDNTIKNFLEDIEII